MQKIPGIGDIPILGYLFKSKASKKRSDRTRRDDHAGDSAEQFAGRDAVASELPGYVHAAAVGSEEDVSRSGARVHRVVTVAGGESGAPRPLRTTAPRSSAHRIGHSQRSTVRAQRQPRPPWPPRPQRRAPSKHSPLPRRLQRSRQRIRRARSLSRPTPMSPNCRRNSVSSRRPHANRLSVMRRLPTRRGRKKRSAPLRAGEAGRARSRAGQEG